MENALRCLNCGYDLRGVAEGVCPECGEGFEIEMLVRSKGSGVLGGLRGLGWQVDFPVLAVVPVLIAIVGVYGFSGSAVDDAVVWGLLAGAVGTSIFVGRRVARRRLRVPRLDGPSVGSVALSIAYALVFFVLQMVLGAAVLFGACVLQMPF